MGASRYSFTPRVPHGSIPGGGGSHNLPHPNHIDGPVTPIGSVHHEPSGPVPPHNNPVPPHHNEPTLTPPSTSTREKATVNDSIEPAPSNRIDTRTGSGRNADRVGYGAGAVIRASAAAVVVIATTVSGIFFANKAYNDGKSTGLRLLGDAESAAAAAAAATTSAAHNAENSLSAALAAAEGLPGDIASGIGGTSSLTSGVTTVLAVGVAAFGAYEIYRFSRWI